MNEEEPSAFCPYGWSKAQHKNKLDKQIVEKAIDDLSKRQKIISYVTCYETVVNVNELKIRLGLI